MSASPVARQAASHCQVIPTKRVLITDPAQMPDLYSSTPGGTIYSTTPGGTRIVYERAFLMNLRDSPISRTPPNCHLPSGLLRGSKDSNPTRHSPPRHLHDTPTVIEEHQEQFDMDI